MPTSFLIVDDHPMVREALAEVVAETSPTANILQAANLSGALRLLEETERIDLVVLDLNLPDAYGFLSLLEVRDKAPSTNILVLTAYEEPRAMQLALLLGANGFLTKASSPQEILCAINHIANGSRKSAKNKKADYPLPEGFVFRKSCQERLTCQELRVLRMLCKGHMNKILAYEMGVTESTIKAHVGEIMRKFGVPNRTQVVVEVISPFERVEYGPSSAGVICAGP
jgi:DNA-binding NarL/FixJ family response regulator